MNLKQIYQKFLREHLDEKWLKNYSNVKILADSLLNGYYILIFEVDNRIEMGELIYEPVY